MRSAADDPNYVEMEIASAVNSYNPNVPPPNVPEASSSSDDDLNDLIQGKAFPVPQGDDDEVKEDRVDEKQFDDNNAEMESVISSSAPPLPIQPDEHQNAENVEDHKVAPESVVEDDAVNGA